MKNTSTLYIAYGSNMNIAQMAQRYVSNIRKVLALS